MLTLILEFGTIPLVLPLFTTVLLSDTQLVARISDSVAILAASVLAETLRIPYVASDYRPPDEGEVTPARLMSRPVLRALS